MSDCPKRPADVLLVEDTPSLSLVYRGFLSAEGIACDLVETGEDAVAALGQAHYRVVLLDLKLPDMDGLEVLRRVDVVDLGSAAVVITAHGSVNVAVDAMKLGASDFLMKPFAKERLLTTVRNALDRTRLQETVDTLTDTFGRKSYYAFVGQSLPMQAVYRTIESVARSRASVFITGESGTGKEICAEAIHQAGPRAGRPFVPLNCGAIPKELIESELFGHVRGAFSGATADRDGAAQMADGGTLFLDEIGEMDINLQVKLLRFLQTGKVQKVGSSELTPVNVRVIAATNRDPLAEVEAGRFREDLYYRLHVVPLHLPPLRERDGDVLEIAQTFLATYAAEEGKAFRQFSAEAEEALLRHPWPGNVRELLNVVRNIVVLHDGDEVTADMIPSLQRPQAAAARNGTAASPAIVRHRHAAAGRPAAPGAVPVVAVGRPLMTIEREVIETTIEMCGGSIPKAARLLDISPSTIYRKKEAWG
ncbi:MAG: sigma-54-dependent Fis family transcriptional regulator [Rhodospirillaceae bacterium]|nr:sigma-54-dependent Fis family transcriptional regulator [Rhodospirillaceae bacterium]